MSFGCTVDASRCHRHPSSGAGNQPVLAPRLGLTLPARSPSRQAPFCVHPKTGKVCVPIDPDAAWEFDPGALLSWEQVCKPARM